jgi:nucleoside-diphosphate-sugar epimerase
MRIFITGANGFIGGAVAVALLKDGHTVRDRAKADLVAAYGVDAVIGSLDDTALLQAEARMADAVVNAASSDHHGAVEALIAGLAGSGKPLIHSSGSSIVGDEAMGEPSDRIFHEETPIQPHADKLARVAIDRLVLDASGIRAAVLCNTMIYGHTPGPPAQSVQIPTLVRQARASLHRTLRRPRPEPLVQRAYRGRGGALRAGHRQGARRNLHVCGERRGGVGRSGSCHRRPA